MRNGSGNAYAAGRKPFISQRRKRKTTCNGSRNLSRNGLLVLWRITAVITMGNVRLMWRHWEKRRNPEAKSAGNSGWCKDIRRCIRDGVRFMRSWERLGWKTGRSGKSWCRVTVQPRTLHLLQSPWEYVNIAKGSAPRRRALNVRGTFVQRRPEWNVDTWKNWALLNGQIP